MRTTRYERLHFFKVQYPPSACGSIHVYPLVHVVATRRPRTPASLQNTEQKFYFDHFFNTFVFTVQKQRRP